MAEKRNKKAAENVLKANRQRLEKESFKYGVPVMLSNYLASTNENASEVYICFIKTFNLLF
jgi:hypothetical protein